MKEAQPEEAAEIFQVCAKCTTKTTLEVSSDSSYPTGFGGVFEVPRLRQRFQLTYEVPEGDCARASAAELGHFICRALAVQNRLLVEFLCPEPKHASAFEKNSCCQVALNGLANCPQAFECPKSVTIPKLYVLTTNYYLPFLFHSRYKLNLIFRKQSECRRGLEEALLAFRPSALSSAVLLHECTLHTLASAVPKRKSLNQMNQTAGSHRL